MFLSDPITKLYVVEERIREMNKRPIAIIHIILIQLQYLGNLLLLKTQ